ncbi:hypothetical protein DXG01_007227 [Tephrocybe rancida]|nr:hypothetical protein DXG01_007227 [Tephrocybe rancida]
MQTDTVLGAITNTDRQTVWPWYKSPILSDTAHNVTLSDPAIFLDYILVTAGKETPLRGERLLVDDGDPAITYTGGWTRNTSVLTGSNGYLRTPLGNSTHQSNDTGATLSFTFTGTSVSLVGVSNYASDSNGINIFLDGNEVPRRVPTANSIPDPTFVWYSTDSLSSGNHTVEVLVVSYIFSPGRFTLDYILYTPSFDSLATKYSTATEPTNSTSTTSGTTPDGTTTQHGSSISTGAIVGIVVAVVVVSIITLLVFLRRRTSRKQPSLSDAKGSIVNPFPLIDGINTRRGTAQQEAQEKPFVGHSHRRLADEAIRSSPQPSMAASPSASTPDRNIGSHLGPFELPEYGAENGPSNLTVQRKPRLPEKQFPQDEHFDGQVDGELPHTNVTPAGEGSSRTRVEHLRQLVVEIQREIAESDITAAREEGVFMREMLNAPPATHGRHGDEMTLPPPYETES